MKNSVVHTFKKLLDSIHPQLCLDARESRRLLAILKTGFRKQLDQHHPPLDSTVKQSLPPIQPSKGRHSHLTPEPDTLTSHIAMSRHVEAILSNPLLSDATTARVELHPAVRHFRHIAARGAASLSSAERCLNSVLYPEKDIKICHLATKAEQIRSARAGSEILNWLESSGQIRQESLEKERKLIRQLALCLAAECRFDVVPNQLNIRLQFDTMKPSTAASNIFEDLSWRFHIGVYYLRAMEDFENPFDIILRYFLQLFEAHEEAVRYSQSLNTEGQLRSGPALGVMGFRLVNMWARSITKPPVSVQQYEALIEKASKWTSHHHEAVAVLQIHHPTKPDASSAISFLQQFPVEKAAECTPAVRESILMLCFDATGLLLKQGDFETSAWVIRYAEKIYPSFSDAEVELESGRSASNSMEPRRSIENRHEELQTLSLLVDRLHAKPN